MKSTGNSICPKCQADQTVRIAYGFPGRETFAAAKRGEIHLGGCCISPESPQWYCQKCECKWRRVHGVNFNVTEAERPLTDAERTELAASLPVLWEKLQKRKAELGCP